MPVKKQDKLVAELYVQMLENLGRKLHKDDIGPTELKLIRDLAKDHDVQVDITQPGNALEAAFGKLPFDENGDPTEELDEFYS
jgi:hypothetical protein